MSFLKNIFGGKKAEPTPSTSESIQKLRDTENLLLKKQEHLEHKLEEELKIAKENASSNKRGKLGSTQTSIDFHLIFRYTIIGWPSSCLSELTRLCCCVVWRKKLEIIKCEISKEKIHVEYFCLEHSLEPPYLKISLFSSSFQSPFKHWNEKNATSNSWSSFREHWRPSRHNVKL